MIFLIICNDDLILLLLFFYCNYTSQNMAFTLKCKWKAIKCSVSYLSLSLLFSQILDLVKGMHYQLACQKYFELTHNVSMPFNSDHPSVFFPPRQLGDDPVIHSLGSAESPATVITSIIILSQPLYFYGFIGALWIQLHLCEFFYSFDLMLFSAWTYWLGSLGQV